MDDTITGPQSGTVRVIPVGTRGARALVFPGGMSVVLRTRADCDEVIKAACAAKNDIPVDYWLSLYGPALAANPDGAA